MEINKEKKKMNGKGDKWRGGWTEEFKNNYNNIFRKENKMKITETTLKQLIKEQLELMEKSRRAAARRRRQCRRRSLSRRPR